MRARPNNQPSAPRLSSFRSPPINRKKNTKKGMIAEYSEANASIEVYVLDVVTVTEPYS